MAITNHDMSRYMKTGPLLKSSWLLASDQVSVLVSTTKPSIRGLFAFGCLGRLHNLLFDLDCMSLYSDLYGIYPCCTIDGKDLYPFKNGFDVRSPESYDVLNSGEAVFSAEENAVTIRNIPLYATLSTVKEAVLPCLTIAVVDNRVNITAEFPANATECRLHLPWYPLYDLYSFEGQKKRIQYYQFGLYSYNGWTEDIASPLTLEDQLSRQSSLRITPSNGVLRLHGCTVPEKNYALYLSTDAVTTSHTLTVSIEVLPAKVTTMGTQYYACDTDAVITTVENGKTTETTFHVPPQHGAHTLTDDRGHTFHYCAVPDNRTMMKKAADAIRTTLWKDGPMAGVPPMKFDPTLLQPFVANGMSYCSHGMRTMSLLCSQGVHANDISYVDTAANAVRQVVKLSHRMPNGAIFTPLLMDTEGSPREYLNGNRPSDTGIILRGLVHIVKAYLHFGEEDKARACMEIARDYAKLLLLMQCPDGSFYDRYRFPTLEPGYPHKGTVNNWCLQVWKLIPLLRRFGMEEAEKLEQLLQKYISYQLDKDNGILYVSGGGEDASDFGDALNTDATLFTIKYLLTKDPVWKDYAEQALKKSWLMSCMWADMPQFFCLHGNSDLGLYYDQPQGLFSAGGMHDLTAVEANLFVAEMLDSAFATDMAEALHNARLSSFIRENGGMYMVILQSPNVYHRDERHSENLMYGGIGVYDWYKAEQASPTLQRLAADTPLA